MKTAQQGNVLLVLKDVNTVMDPIHALSAQKPIFCIKEFVIPGDVLKELIFMTSQQISVSQTLAFITKMKETA